jgi:hypothetical protein
MRASVTIRYCGNEDFSRRFLLQRQDGSYYTGRGWSARLGEARLYDKLSTAQRAYRAVMNRKYRKQPARKFRLQLDLSVRGSGRFSADDLRRFLSAALHLNFDNAAAGDGPRGNFVQAVAALWSLEEVDSNKACRIEVEKE